MVYYGKEVMSDYVATGDWCYYCRTYYSEENITPVLMTNDEKRAVCDDCLRGMTYTKKWRVSND